MLDCVGQPLRNEALEQGALSLVRRADWRFLLPNPGLGRVAYLAPHDAELVAALELVSRSVELLEAPAEPRGCELVVLTARPPDAAITARRLLRPDGWLYAEVPGYGVRGWERELLAIGFDEVAAYWLSPDEHKCREVVPLEPNALRHSLGRRDPGARLRVRVRLACLLASSGAFRLAARRAAVIGRWRP
jgi:hypothetical protein